MAFTYHGGGILSKERADGRTVYFVRYRRNGRAIVERVGLTEEAARKRLEARRDQATDPNWVPPSSGSGPWTRSPTCGGPGSA